MDNYQLSPEDLPDAIDDQLQRKLDEATTEYFYRSCPPAIQLLLSRCEWYLTTRSALTLVIACPDAKTNWEILDCMSTLAIFLGQFAKNAKICLYPLDREETPLEIRVDERIIYQD